MLAELDVIGPWSEVKLDILREYAAPYSKIVTARGFHHLYIEGFAGPGSHLSRKSGEIVPGSPLNALSTDPPFNEYHFIDKDPTGIEVQVTYLWNPDSQLSHSSGQRLVLVPVGVVSTLLAPLPASSSQKLFSFQLHGGVDQLLTPRVGQLQSHVGNRTNVYVYAGDCNEILLQKVFPRVRYEEYRRALCVLDPFNIDLSLGGRCGSGAHAVGRDLSQFYGDGHEYECPVEQPWKSRP